MIVRDNLQCRTCSAPHTVRVGVGHEHRHTHRFACRGCGEEIAITLAADPPAAWVEFDENCDRAAAVPGADIVNLDANFLMPIDQQGKDFVMPRLQQQHQMVKAVLAAGGRFPSSDPFGERLPRPYRRPDYATEWNELQRAWSLTKNGKAVLARSQIKRANETIYAQDPVSDLSDWFWRLSTAMTQPAFEQVFEGALQAFKPLHGTPNVMAFRAHYAEMMRKGRSAKYVKIMREYFVGYSDFAQLQFLVASGVEIDPDLRATGADFAKTSMFYGNAFEVLGDLVDLLATINNMLLGRAFDTFERLPSLGAYLELDKGARPGPFAANAALAAFVGEYDNQLRNASHHGGIDFNAASGTLTCRAGKGGQGAERTLTYTEYLQRCVRIFMTTMALLRFELVMATQLKIPRLFD